MQKHLDSITIAFDAELALRAVVIHWVNGNRETWRVRTLDYPEDIDGKRFTVE